MCGAGACPPPRELAVMDITTPGARWDCRSDWVDGSPCFAPWPSQTRSFWGLNRPPLHRTGFRQSTICRLCPISLSSLRDDLRAAARLALRISLPTVDLARLNSCSRSSFTTLFALGRDILRPALIWAEELVAVELSRPMLFRRLSMASGVRAFRPFLPHFPRLPTMACGALPDLILITPRTASRFRGLPGSHCCACWGIRSAPGTYAGSRSPYACLIRRTRSS